MTFPTPSVECTNVHVVEHETGSIRHTETGHNLVGTVSAEHCEVGVHAIVPEAAFQTNFIRSGHFRLQVLVRTGVTILVTTTHEAGWFKFWVD